MLQPQSPNADIGQLGDPAVARKIVGQAAYAVFHLWDLRRGSFWRSIEHRTGEEASDKLEFFPTVTFRCAEALLCLLEDFPEWTTPEVEELLVSSFVPSLLARDEKDLHSTLGLTSEAGILNPFSLSLYVDVLARICQCRHFGLTTKQDATRKLQSTAEHLLSYTSLSKYPREVGPQVHPFVLFHVVRAIHLSLPHIPSSELQAQLLQFAHDISDSLREAMKELLARQSLGVLNPGEAVALAFCAACLGMRDRDDLDDYPYIAAALNASLKFQDASGCWPLGRVVPENKDIKTTRDLQIPTYEIAWALAETLSSLIAKRKEAAQEPEMLVTFQRLILAAKYATVSVVQLPAGRPPARGWCSDHAYGKPMIESWTSATVLQAALSLYDLIETMNRELILNSFTAVYPQDPDWPDWLHWHKYKLDCEPEQDFSILDYLDRNLIQVIGRSAGQLPRAKDRDVSFILFGPPGTTETTIVKAVAQGLGWPILILSPGNFIERGLEYIEAQSRTVFDLILRLSRVVVLFDECDELFRDRKPLPGTEQVRSITAFVTASMLPKLQELHDRGRVVFSVCTNQLETMDPAIKRGGRIDHIIGVGPADKTARQQIIRQGLSKHLGVPYIGEAIEELAAQTERFTRVEIVRAVDLMGVTFASANEAKNAARKVAERLRPALTIRMQDYEDFLRLRKEFSHPHIERGER